MSIRNNEKAQAYLQKKKVPELFEVSCAMHVLKQMHPF